MPELLDNCCEVIALKLRSVVQESSQKDPELTSVSKEEDKRLRETYNVAYMQSYKLESDALFYNKV